jgi:hypothetical protein
MSYVTRHTSHITRHTSHVTRHTSHITHHVPGIGYDTSVPSFDYVEAAKTMLHQALLLLPPPLLLLSHLSPPDPSSFALRFLCSGTAVLQGCERCPPQAPNITTAFFLFLADSAAAAAAPSRLTPRLADPPSG